MPTVNENKKAWDGQYSWPNLGDEWSVAWGGPFMQWYGTILPRIHRFIPTGSILEIACGYGRWTQFLKDMCHELEVIDLSEECIQACKQRFIKNTNIKYYLNDGKSLEMISDDSIDFVFSFDSLVHADESIIKSYFSQLPRILRDNGAAFIHHSNLGEYYPVYSLIRKVPGLEVILKKLCILEKDLHWRDSGVSARSVEKLAENYALKCISQEIIPWGTKRAQIDCFSTIVKKTSPLARDNHILRNTSFSEEVKNLSQLSRLYTMDQK